MNKNFASILLVAVLIIGGGIVYYTLGSKETDIVVTPTPTQKTPIEEEKVEKNADADTTRPTPKYSTPIVVTGSAYTASATTIITTGTVNPQGAFTSYWYEYGVTSSLGSKTSSQNVGSGFVSIQAPIYIINLTKNTTYYFRLVAENQYGRVVGNAYSFKTTEAPAPIGSVPTTKTSAASNVSRTTATMNGDVVPNKVATQYWFEYGKTANLGNTSFFASAGNGDDRVSVAVSLSELEPSTTYFYRLNAQNSFGTVNGSIVNFKTTVAVTTVMPKVVSQNASSVDKTDATLHGTVNPGGLDTRYWFEYSTDSLLGSLLVKRTDENTLSSGLGLTSVKADIASLDSNKTYYFRLVARNNLGTVYGDKMSFKTKR